MMVRDRKPVDAPKGVRILGVVIIFSSLLQMGKLAGDLLWYEKIFSYLSPLIMAARYFFSWALRIAGLAAGIGILRRRDICRKILIGIAVFTILTVHQKHPERAFSLHARYLDKQYQVFLLRHDLGSNLFSSLAKTSRITHIVADVMFHGVLLVYLTRPGVKKWFAGERGSGAFNKGVTL